MSKVVNIMGIPFDNLSKQNLIDKLLNLEKTKGFIVTANPEIVMETRDNDYYKSCILKADYVIADGMGIILASKWLKHPL
ncbi:MAG: glycosyltransferase, partial [Epulopiscium sp.]|nr:glycosyltransferase [Candidatus Epulonipiscium sp.]